MYSHSAQQQTYVPHDQSIGDALQSAFHAQHPACLQILHTRPDADQRCILRAVTSVSVCVLVYMCLCAALSTSEFVFLLQFYKRILCARKEKHEWAACTFAHPGERANRRDPRSHGPTLCQELEKVRPGCQANRLPVRLSGLWLSGRVQKHTAL